MECILATVRWRCLALGVVLLVSAPGVAAAQEPRVRYDPDSPAGKEYVLPLEQARAQGSSRTGAAAAPVLFGAGITKASAAPAKPDTAPGQAAAPGERAGPSPRSRPGHTGRKMDPPSPPGANATTAPPAQADEGAISGLSAAVGIGAAVLLGGLVLSFLLSRGRRAVA